MDQDNEARAINELSRRLAEKDKQDKSKKKIFHSNNMSLTEEDKMRLLPDLRMQSRRGAHAPYEFVSLEYLYIMSS